VIVPILFGGLFFLIGVVGLIRLPDAQRLMVQAASLSPLQTRHRDWDSHARTFCTVFLVACCVFGVTFVGFGLAA
jgi:multisubunit Na+/H+ antiporter MnhG subunit